jgi:CarboxypepD_reg-like domain/TonB-dependent Receptor Plug Domain
MKTLLTTILILVACSAYAISISGYIADFENGETIIGANVIVEGQQRGASTDLDGFFAIPGLKPGQIQLNISHLSYKDTSITIDLTGSSFFIGTITLAKSIYESEAIVVTGKRREVIDKELDISSFEVDPIILSEAPVFNKDVFKLVKFSPSVTISDEYSPLYYVRGSDPGENMIQLDGMTIYNPQHLVSGTAIFNPYALKNIEMLVGGYDAGNGGRNASILSLTSREGNQKETHGEFTATTSGITGAVESPAPFNGTAMLSGRVMSSLTAQFLVGMPNLMADFNGAYQTTIKRTKIRLSAFYARDDIEFNYNKFSIYFEDEDLRNIDIGFETNTENAAIGLRTRSIISSNLVLKSHFYYSMFKVDNINTLKFTSEFDDEDDSEIGYDLDYSIRIKNSIRDFTAKSSLSYFTPYNQTFTIGAEQNNYDLSNSTGVRSLMSVKSEALPTLQAFYIQDRINIGNLLVKVGFRRNRFAPRNIWYDEPRASAALEFFNSTFKFSWGRYHQYLTSMNTQDYELSQAVEYYYPIRYNDPLKSTHYIFAMERKYSDEIDYLVAAYYKDLSTQYKFDFVNTISNVQDYRASLEKGDGKAYGVEFTLKGKFGKLSGWGSYSYSKSTRSFPSVQNGQEFLFDGDQTHSLKTVLLYNFTRDITGSTTLQLTSGYPRTWATGNISYFNYDPLNSGINTTYATITPVKNNVRYPMRMKLDIGWKKRMRSGFGYNLAEALGGKSAMFTMKLENILFLRRNPVYYVYIQDIGYYALDPEFVPFVSIGYSIKF